MRRKSVTKKPADKKKVQKKPNWLTGGHLGGKGNDSSFELTVSAGYEWVLLSTIDVLNQKQPPGGSSVSNNGGVYTSPKADTVSAAMPWEGDGEEFTYFFLDDEYIRYTVDNSAPDAGYPRDISQWSLPSSFNTGIDAAVKWENYLYIFKDAEYTRYTIGSSQPDEGFPRPVSHWNFPSAFNQGIDAAVEWKDDKVFFFKGNQYLRYTVGNTQPDPGYPQPLSSWNFPASFDQGIDAAMKWGNKVYFFKGGQYIRYDVDGLEPDAGYPVSISEWRFPKSL